MLTKSGNTVKLSFEMSPTLQKQLENARFERALEVVESIAEHRALLTTTELARLNNILTGHSPGGGTNAGQPSHDPWRKGPVTLTLPSGQKETLALIADPKVTARENLHTATEAAEQGGALDAAVNLYVNLVLAHVFEDANRRTAVLAAQYFLKRYELPVSGVALHDLGLGDIRRPEQVQELRARVRSLIATSSRR